MLRSPPPGPLTLGNPGGDTLPRRKKGVSAPRSGELLSPPREGCGRVGGGGGCKPRGGLGAPRLPCGPRMAPPAVAGAHSPAPGTGSGLGPATSLLQPLPPSPAAAAAAAREAGVGRQLVLRRAASGPGRRRTPAVNAGGRGCSSRPGSRAGPTRLGALGARAGALRAHGGGLAGRPGFHHCSAAAAARYTGPAPSGPG